MATNAPEVNCFFHTETSTCTYVVKDATSNHAMIIDPVMDFDMASANTGQDHNEKVAEFCESRALEVDYIIETHVHADHLTGAQFLSTRFPAAKTAIGEHVKDVQALFKQVFNLDAKADQFEPDGSQFSLLLKDNQEFVLGDNTPVKVLHTPGHTPACVSLVVGDAVFTGDTLFMPDMGTARCDFPGGSVEQLYNSIQRIYELPDSTRVFVGHDYGPGGREIKWETTIGESKANNKQIKAETPLKEFGTFRRNRDAQLNAPRLIIPALQVNLRNGVLPPPEENGTSYLKVPINVIGAKK